jgi:hypothetical protein
MDVSVNTRMTQILFYKVQLYFPFQIKLATPFNTYTCHSTRALHGH